VNTGEDIIRKIQKRRFLMIDRIFRIILTVVIILLAGTVTLRASEEIFDAIKS